MSVQSGSIRFNTDSLRLEIYNGEKWWEIDSTSPDQQTGGTRMLIGGGKLTHPARQNVIQFINLDTIGNAIDFGDLMGNSMINSGSFASQVRGFFLDKQLSGILAYNEFDAFTTHLLWARIAHFSGLLSSDEYSEEQMHVRKLLDSERQSGKVHLQKFIDEWDRLREVTGQQKLIL